MKNRLEEKIGKFIKEVEVSNVVAPESFVDAERKAWLKKQGKDAPGLSTEGRMEGDQGAGIFEADEQVTCPKCSGTGRRDGKTCDVCRGKKKISRMTWEKNYGNPKTMKESKNLDQGIVETVIEIAAKYSKSKEIWDERDVEHASMKELLQSIKNTGFIPENRWNAFLNNVSGYFKVK